MLILFDIDDTLLDDTAATSAGARALHQSVVSSLPVEEFLARWGEALERHFGRYLAGEVSFQDQRRARIREMVDFTPTDAEADRIFAIYLAAYEAGWSLFPDVKVCLDRLSSSHSLGIVSNGEVQQQRRKLARTGIVGRFECILISEECGFAKPSKEIFLRACDIVGESSTNAVYVGDRYDVDAQGARAAGLVGVWLDRQARAMAHHQPPLIRGLAELSSLLDSDALPNHGVAADGILRPFGRSDGRR
jgi:putative hydrolase of the HAD superfamily